MEGSWVWRRGGGAGKRREKARDEKEELGEERDRRERETRMDGGDFAHPNSALGFLLLLKRNTGGESCSEALPRILDAPSSPPSLSFNPSHILEESIVAY